MKTVSMTNQSGYLEGALYDGYKWGSAAGSFNTGRNVVHASGCNRVLTPEAISSENMYSYGNQFSSVRSRLGRVAESGGNSMDLSGASILPHPSQSYFSSDFSGNWNGPFPIDVQSSFTYQLQQPQKIPLHGYTTTFNRGAPYSGSICGPQPHMLASQPLQQISYLSGAQFHGPTLAQSQSNVLGHGEPDDEVWLKLMSIIKRAYSSFKSSLPSKCDSQAQFLRYLHSEKCSATRCMCDLYAALVSHFDICGGSYCNICAPPGLSGIVKQNTVCHHGEVSGQSTLEDGMLSEYQQSKSFEGGDINAWSQKSYISSKVYQNSKSQSTEVAEVNSGRSYERNARGNEFQHKGFAQQSSPEDDLTSLKHQMIKDQYSFGSATSTCSLQDDPVSHEGLPGKRQLHRNFFPIAREVDKANLGINVSHHERDSMRIPLENGLPHLKSQRIYNQWSPESDASCAFSQTGSSVASEGLRDLHQMPEIPQSFDIEAAEVNSDRSSLYSDTNSCGKRINMVEVSEQLKLRKRSYISEEPSITCQPEDSMVSTVSQNIGEVADDQLGKNFKIVIVPTEMPLEKHLQPIIQIKTVAAVISPELEMKPQAQKMEIDLAEISTVPLHEEPMRNLRQWTDKSTKRSADEDCAQLSPESYKDMLPSSKRTRMENQSSTESESEKSCAPLAPEKQLLAPKVQKMLKTQQPLDYLVTELNTDSIFMHGLTNTSDKRKNILDSCEPMCWSKTCVSEELAPESIQAELTVISEKIDGICNDIPSTRVVPMSPKELIHSNSGKQVQLKAISKEGSSIAQRENDTDACEVHKCKGTLSTSEELSNLCESNQGIPTDISGKRDQVSDDYHALSSKIVLVSPENNVGDHEGEKMHLRTKLQEEGTPPPTECEYIAPDGCLMLETKSKKQLIGVSLTEIFTAEEHQEHIKSLQQRTDEDGPLKIAENVATHRDTFCQLCAMETLTFAPMPIFCSSCTRRIKGKFGYYCTLDDSTPRLCFCASCYNKSRGQDINVDGNVIPKSKLGKKNTEEGDGEPWVECDRCGSWQHQVCALFNAKKNLGGQAVYLCPTCLLKDIETGKHRPRPETFAFGAKNLPTSKLSDHIEQRLSVRLKQERKERAESERMSVDKVPAARDLVVRVVSSVKKQLEVGKRFLSIFSDKRYPSEFPYYSKVILLFQKIEGVDVCLFAMHVQEFGSECHHPNQRCVYISYLDSVKYFRPDIKTVTGEALRTFVYHEILIGYLDYCKRRGFATCYIWACPPAKGEDYILYCHPEVQKTPKSNKLRQWYKSMLGKAGDENIVLDTTNLYDYYFSPLECNRTVTAAHLPYFSGDFWTNAAEGMISDIEKESEEQRKRRAKKLLPRRNLKAMEQIDQSDGAAKDILLMQKLGKAILPVKEDFLLAHLQFVCSCCGELTPSREECLCDQPKNCHLCQRCHNAKQGINQIDIERNRTNVESCSKMSDTEDFDINLDNPLFDSRTTFLAFCQENNYLFDTPRRAKHSSMMILYHLHSLSNAKAMCKICKRNTVKHQIWLSESSPNFHVCHTCCQRDGASNEKHRITENGAAHSNKGTQQRKGWPDAREIQNLLVHASDCDTTQSHSCSYPNCSEIKKLFHHVQKCSVRITGNCVPCRKAWSLLIAHSKQCARSDCRVPRCMDLKNRKRKLR